MDNKTLDIQKLEKNLTQFQFRKYQRYCSGILEFTIVPDIISDLKLKYLQDSNNIGAR